MMMLTTRCVTQLVVDCSPDLRRCAVCFFLMKTQPIACCCCWSSCSRGTSSSHHGPSHLVLLDSCRMLLTCYSNNRTKIQGAVEIENTDRQEESLSNRSDWHPVLLLDWFSQNSSVFKLLVDCFLLTCICLDHCLHMYDSACCCFLRFA
jgi:hypothetical protein